MVTLSQEIENVIQKYQGETVLEQYHDMQSTDLLRRGPEEELDSMDPLNLEAVERIYQSHDSVADALEELYELGESWEENATRYMLQQNLIDELQDIKLE